MNQPIAHLLPGMTIGDMKSGVSRIRNPIIARVFRELGLVEQWGSGIKCIFGEAVRQELPEPIIEEIATGMRLRIFLGSQHVTEILEAPNKKSEQVSEQVVTLLRYCSEQVRSRQALLAKIGLSNAYLNYKRHIVPLLEQGLLELTIPDKPRSRLQQYRLALEGRRLLKQLKKEKA